MDKPINDMELTKYDEEYSHERQKQKKILLDLFAKDGFLLAQADPDACCDRDLIQQAVSSRGMAIKYARDNYDDIELAKIAIESCPQSIKHFQKKIRKNRDLMALALKKDGLCYKDIPQVLKNDRELAKIAVSNNGLSLKYMPRFKGDQEIVDIAISNYPDALRYSSFLSDYDMVMKAISQDGSLFYFISSDLQNNYHILRETVRTFQPILKYVPAPTHELIIYACQFSGNVLETYPDLDKETVKQCLTVYGQNLVYTDFTEDFEMVLISAKTYPDIICYYEPKNKDEIKQLIACNHRIIKYFLRELKDDMELLSYTLKECPYAFWYFRYLPYEFTLALNTDFDFSVFFVKDYKKIEIPEKIKDYK